MENPQEGLYPQQLRMDPAWFQAIVDNIVDAFILLDSEGSIIALNPTVLQIFGFDSEELVGKPVASLIPAMQPTFKRDYERPTINVVIGLEYDGIRKDGTTLPLRLDIQAFHFDGNKYFTLIARDNSANRELEAMSRDALDEAIEALEQEREKTAQQADEMEKRRSRLRTIIDTNEDVTILVSPDGIFVDVDQQFTNIFGIERETMIGLGWGEFIPEIYHIFENPQDFVELVNNTARDEEADLKEIVVQKWPQRRELQLTSRPFIHKDQYVGRLYNFRDVTYEREVDRMKTQFVSMVSHELRTPLTSIKGFTEMVLDEDAGEINEEQEEYLSIVLNNSDRLIALVNDLLDVSRIESGRVELKLDEIDVDDIVTITEATMQHLFEKKSQSFEVDVEDELPLLEVDRDRVIQVLTNLVSNAHKYTPEGGHILLAVSREDGFARFAVIDDGFGITEENQKKLFTRFFRVDNDLTREIGGTGLGLNITKSIIEKHGGEVTVDSEFGKGSTFAFTVPFVNESDSSINKEE